MIFFFESSAESPSCFPSPLSHKLWELVPNTSSDTLFRRVLLRLMKYTFTLRYFLFYNDVIGDFYNVLCILEYPVKYRNLTEITYLLLIFYYTTKYPKEKSFVFLGVKLESVSFGHIQWFRTSTVSLCPVFV